VNNLPKVVAWRLRGRNSNPQPANCKSDALTTTPLHYAGLTLPYLNINHYSTVKRMKRFLILRSFFRAKLHYTDTGYEHRLRTPPTEKLATILHQICQIAIKPNISTCQDVGMWQIFVRWWCSLQLQLQSYTIQRIVLRGIMQCYRLVGKDGFSALIGTVGDC